MYTYLWHYEYLPNWKEHISDKKWIKLKVTAGMYLLVVLITANAYEME